MPSPNSLGVVRRSICLAILGTAVVVACTSTAVSDDAQEASLDECPKQTETSPADMVRMAFPLNSAAADQDEAKAFVERYRGAKNVPKIYGAYIDYKKRSLIVVGPAEAKRHIHGLMAMWDCELAGIDFGSDSLDAQKAKLVDEYRSLIVEITVLELAQVDRDSPQLAAEIKRFSADLEKVKRKLVIFNKRQKQLDEFEKSIRTDERVTTPRLSDAAGEKPAAKARDRK